MGSIISMTKLEFLTFGSQIWSNLRYLICFSQKVANFLLITKIDIKNSKNAFCKNQSVLKNFDFMRYIICLIRYFIIFFSHFISFLSRESNIKKNQEFIQSFSKKMKNSSNCFISYQLFLHVIINFFYFSFPFIKMH